MSVARESDDMTGESGAATEFSVDPPAGDSLVQRVAKVAMLKELVVVLGYPLRKDRMTAPDGSVVDFDGWSAEPPTLVEAWAHQGPPKAAQKLKVMTDALKLVWGQRTFLPEARLILLFADGAAARHFRLTSWMASAIRSFGIEIVVADLPAAVRARIRAAQARQFR